MVGSLAECFAEYYYGLVLYAPSNPGHDAHVENRKIEIKMTQGDRVALRSGPESLLVFRLLTDGEFEEVYNGPGARVWALVEGRARPSNGQYQVSLTQLRRLMKDGASRAAVAKDSRLTRQCTRRRFAPRVIARAFSGRDERRIRSSRKAGARGAKVWNQLRSAQIGNPVGASGSDARKHGGGASPASGVQRIL
jgi:hypothetical protein